MSVTMRLSDEDARLIGKVLGAVGKAAIEVRGLVLTPQEERENEINSSSPAHIALAAKKTKTLGNKIAVLVGTPYALPDELVRLGFAFDTAVYANEPKR